LQTENEQGSREENAVARVPEFLERRRLLRNE
jgi:hypothetical protein